MNKSHLMVTVSLNENRDKELSVQHSLSGSLYLLNCKLTFALFLTADRKMQARVGCSQMHSDPYHIFISKRDHFLSDV